MIENSKLLFSLPNVSDSDYKHYESKFNILVKCCNYFYFGNGEYLIIPLFWLVTATISTIFSLALGEPPTIGEIFSSSVNLLELYINVTFGFYFCKDHIVARTVLYYHKHYELNMNMVEQYFSLMSLCITVVFFLMLSIYAAILVTNNVEIDDITVKADYAFASINNFCTIFIVIGGSLHLCVLWCIQVWIIYSCIERHFSEVITLNKTTDSITSANSIYSDRLRSVDFVNTIDGDDKSLELQMYSKDAPLDEKLKELIMTDPSKVFHQQNFERKFLQYLYDMKEISNYWHTNHVVRTLSGLLIITNMSITFYIAYTFQAPIYIVMMFGIAAGSYFVTIWITAFSAGITNDRYFEFVINRLSCLYAEVLEENAVLDKRISRSISKIVALRSSEGMHFGGVTMSTEKALTVGSILGSVITYVIKIYSGKSIE